jgi:hypothetical protein
MADLASFSVVSYNCRGLSALKRSYVKSLLAKATILFLQEHWLTDDQLCCLDVIDDNFSFTGVAGFDNKEVLDGRPYGGCAIMWRSEIVANIKIIKTKA